LVPIRTLESSGGKLVKTQIEKKKKHKLQGPNLRVLDSASLGSTQEFACLNSLDIGAADPQAIHGFWGPKT
jgi:hypothetical protein